MKKAKTLFQRKNENNYKTKKSYNQYLRGVHEVLHNRIK